MFIVGVRHSGHTVQIHNVLECGLMPNVMATLPITGGALCTTPQILADAHC